MGILRVSVFSACTGMLLVLGACGDDEGTSCGPGTELIGGECVVTDGGQQTTGGSSGRIGGGGTSGRPSTMTDSGTPLTCGDGAFVSDNMCEPLRPVGGPCEVGTECETGTCLPESAGVPGGYCSVSGCSENRQCPAGSHCYFSSRTEAYVCLVYCDNDVDCREDYVCQPLYTTAVHICAPNCTISGICTNASICDEESGKCVLRECDPTMPTGCDPDDPNRICVRDSRGISTTGGLCLPMCDPSAADADDPCSSIEVCQPLPGDPVHTGICAPPICATTANCPPGATCLDRVCQPPARCDDDGACADDTTVCVGGPGGQCMPECPTGDGESCADIHVGLSCATTLGACLPTGSFPGSACRADANSPCSDLTVRHDDGTTSVTHQVCEDVRGNPTCLASCEADPTYCPDISDVLVCATGIFDSPVCLPKGAFPGGPCDANSACGTLYTAGGDIPMSCERNKCLIECNNDAAATGAQLCAAISGNLVCAENLFGDGKDTCLPRGAFPGGPCAAGNVCDTGMSCQNSICLYQCTDTPGCEALSPTLACAVGVYSEPVCLPKGAFPGGPCGASDACAQNVGGNTSADMFCQAGTCLLQCQEPGPFTSGDALCTNVNAALTCVTSAGTDFCVRSCQAGVCATGYSCLASENACLPTGSFPGSPCRATSGNECDQNVGGNANVDMACVNNTCVVLCPSNNDALCGAVNAALTCSESAGNICVVGCVGGACPSGYSCLRPGTENACLPNGSFLGSACAGGTACSASATPTLACIPNGGSPICMAGCAGATPNPTTYCTTLGTNLSTGWDACADGDPGTPEVLICVDSTP